MHSKLLNYYWSNKKCAKSEDTIFLKSQKNQVIADILKIVLWLSKISKNNTQFSFIPLIVLIRFLRYLYLWKNTEHSNKIFSKKYKHNQKDQQNINQQDQHNEAQSEYIVIYNFMKEVLELLTFIWIIYYAYNAGRIKTKDFHQRIA